MLGDPAKARDKLGWRARIVFLKLVSEMVRKDLDYALRTDVMCNEGFEVSGTARVAAGRKKARSLWGTP